jgi:hypothetical protein
MFVAAMTPNQDLFTNLISNLYSQGLEQATVKTLYSPFFVEGPKVGSSEFAFVER